MAASIEAIQSQLADITPALLAQAQALRAELADVAQTLQAHLDAVHGAVTQVAPSLHPNLDNMRAEVAQLAPPLLAALDGLRAEMGSITLGLHANIDALRRDALSSNLDKMRAEVAQLAPPLRAALDGLRAEMGSIALGLHANIDALRRDALSRSAEPAAHHADAGERSLVLDDSERSIVAAVREYTMLSVARILALRDAILYVEREQIPGAIVECGVWRGGAMMAAALTLLEVGPGTRDIYLFDTFAGMTPPGEADRDPTGVPAADLLAREDRETSWLWGYATLADARKNLARTGYPAAHLHFMEGSVEETIPAQAPGRIAVLHLDTDWYASTQHELRHLVPRVPANGVLIVDDYGDWLGSRKAVDEFLQETDRPVLFGRTDHTGRMAVLPVTLDRDS